MLFLRATLEVSGRGSLEVAGGALSVVRTGLLTPLVAGAGAGAGARRMGDC